MALAGTLTLAPGSERPVRCRRPVVGAELMRRLAEGRRAALLPELVGAVFSLCAGAQRSTSRRVVAAALGRATSDDAAALALETAHEHLRRIAIDLPRSLPVPGIAADAGWLRGAPLLPPASHPARAARLAESLAALPAWLGHHLYGMPPADWLRCWRSDPATWLARWAAASPHPHARWLAALRPRAEALWLPYRPLPAGSAGFAALAESLATDDGFAERPLWQQRPAETGPWTRAARTEPAGADGAQLSVWHRLGARLADLAAIAEGEPLAAGALALAPGEAIAWTEMARGLLVHWLRLEPGAQAAETARAAVYRVVAPTEWNFHPEGALAAALGEGGFDAADARPAALALDPCIAFEVAADA